MARADICGALSVDVARSFAARARHSRRAQAQSFKEQSDAALAAHEQALGEARGRAQALATERRERATAAAETRRNEIEAKLSTHIAEAEKTIAQKRADAMTNVRGIAADAAAAIIERLIGKSPTREQVSEALDVVMKS